MKCRYQLLKKEKEKRNIEHDIYTINLITADLISVKYIILLYKKNNIVIFRF